MSKPIRVFFSPLTGEFYATKAYKIMANGVVKVTGEKYNVTQDIARAIVSNEVTFTSADLAAQDD